MQKLQGIAVSPGVAIGEALVMDNEGFRIPRRFVARDAVVDELERQLAVLGREMKPEHKARVIRALYQLGLEQGNVTKDVVAGVLDVAVARGR